MPTLKFWKWFKRQPKEENNKPKDEKVKIYPARNVALVTSESNLKLVPCRVFDDHTLKVQKKTVQIKPDRPAHILELPLGQLMPTWLGRRFAPRTQRFNVYTYQQTGELTHDPHLDHLSEEMKMRFEKLLMLMGKFAEADAGAAVYEGMKEKKKWFDYIPYMAIVFIVFLFLFAYFK